jgi:hypothetical protein
VCQHPIIDQQNETIFRIFGERHSRLVIGEKGYDEEDEAFRSEVEWLRKDDGRARRSEIFLMGLKTLNGHLYRASTERELQSAQLTIIGIVGNLSY